MFKVEYYPEEIAETLCRVVGDEFDEDIVKDCEEALNHLKIVAENPHNKDYFRVFYRALERFTDVH